MSRLEKLLQTLCPDGVEYQKLGDICQIATGKLNVNKQSDNGKYPFFTCAKEVYRIDTFAFDTEALLISGNGNVGYIHYYNGKFNAYQRTYVLSNFSINILFVKHVLEWGLKKRIAEGLRLGSVPYIKLETLRDFFIPLPPLPVQEEIVRILDTFSGVVAELEQKLDAEQAARVRQYEHYRNELLSFDSKSRIMEKLFAEQCLDRVQYVKLKEVAHISAGGDLPENYVKGQKVPTEQFPFPIYSNGTDDNALYGFTDNYKIEKEAVTISARGTIGYHEVRAGKFTPIVRLITMIADESKITTKFLNYVLNIAGIEGVNTGIPSLTVPMLEKITIPLPPLPIQEQIVSILDHFDALVNDLKTGLPAEIALRRKQYEYYRDKLLTFEPKQPPL